MAGHASVRTIVLMYADTTAGVLGRPDRPPARGRAWEARGLEAEEMAGG
jgi:hypothetical protein